MDHVAAASPAKHERTALRPVQLDVDDGPVLVAHNGAGLEAKGPGQQGQGALGVLIAENRDRKSVV